MATTEATRQQTTLVAFGHLLKRLRLAADLTQEELAERAGVSARLVSDLERGTIHRPRRDTVQLLADGLGLRGAERDAFVALARGRPPVAAATGGRPHSLRLPPTPLVGRLKETAAVTSLVLRPDRPEGTRLVTLTGPGGVGKTRLALEVAARAGDSFPDGVCFVELAPLQDPALLLPAIAKTLGVRESGERPLADGLAAALQGRRLLLVLDNLEHLTPAAPALGELLAACPGLTLLVTSRQPLRLRAEREYAVAPLALPDLERLPPIADLARVPAVELFVERAEMASRSFALTDANARAVAEIAVRLDGLPLALELAAARIKILAPAALLARLEHRLPLLTGGAQDLPARLRTMRDAIAWSHDQLSAAEQRLFRRLAVFAGGCTLDAAEFVGRGTEDGGRREHGAGDDIPVFQLPPPVLPPPSSVLDLLTSLVDKCLLRGIDSGEDDPRFGMLETVREYALERLAAAWEETEARQRHQTWCLGLAEQAEVELEGPDQARWYARLDAEHDNLRAALGWALDQRDAETALRLASAIQRFWTTRAQLGEGRRWLEQVLGTSAAVAPPVRAKALAVVARFAYFQGDYGPAAGFGEEALTRFRALGNQAGIGVALGALALVSEAIGDDERATALYEEALGCFQLVGDRIQASAVFNDLGMLAWRRGDVERAATRQEEALTLARESGSRVGLAAALCGLALVSTDLGDYARAAVLARELLTLHVELGNKRGLLDSFETFAVIAAATRDDERAARLFGVAEALRRWIGASAVPKDRAYNEPRIAAVRGRLGEEAFAATWASGRAMSLDDAIAYALERGRWHPVDAPSLSATTVESFT